MHMHVTCMHVYYMLCVVENCKEEKQESWFGFGLNACVQDHQKLNLNFAFIGYKT